MTTTTVRFVGSLDKVRSVFAHSDCHSYKRVSGNYKRGTYLLEVREGSLLQRVLEGEG